MAFSWRYLTPAEAFLRSAGLGSRFGFVDVTTDAIADAGKHAAIQDLINRLGRAYAWSATHVSSWAATFSTTYNTSLAIAQLMESRSASKFVPLDGKVTTALQGIADLYTKNGVIKSVDVSRAFDRTFTVPATLPAGV